MTKTVCAAVERNPRSSHRAAPKLISLAGRSPRYAHCNLPKNSSRRRGGLFSKLSWAGPVTSRWACPAHAVFVPSVEEENPCPCTAAQHTTTPTVIIFGQPTPKPKACLSCPMAQCLCRSDLTRNTRPSRTSIWAPNHHRHQLRVPCCTSKQVSAQGAQDPISSGPSRGQPGLARTSRSYRPNNKPANRWPAEPSPSPHQPPKLHFSLQRRVSTRTLHHRPTKLIPVRARTQSPWRRLELRCSRPHPFEALRQSSGHDLRGSTSLTRSTSLALHYVPPGIVCFH